MAGHMEPGDREAQRIERVYSRRTGGRAASWYDANRPEVQQQIVEVDTAVAHTIRTLNPIDLGAFRCLDVGCGAGRYLRTLISLGVDPRNTAGTELLSDRLDAAMESLPDGPQWHLGQLSDFSETPGFDLVSAFTVFSSILDQAVRSSLAMDMWDRTKPGGAVIVYDFRYNNPRNPDVRKVTRSELKLLFPAAETSYTTMTLAPPLSRPAAKLTPRLIPILGAVPLLRSHFWFVGRKPL